MYIKKHDMHIAQIKPEIQLFKTRERASPKKQLDVALYLSAVEKKSQQSSKKILTKE